jgi:Domain of unknown function (DUF4136)
MSRPTTCTLPACRFEAFLLWAVLLLLATPSNAQKITTTVNSPFDFAAAKHYAWKENHIITRQGKANDALIDKKIVEEVNRNLAAKGFSQDAANPDFYISYDAGSSDTAVAVEGGITQHPVVNTATPPPVYGIPQNVWYSVDGIISFHMVDAKTGKPIWTVVAKKKIHDPHKGMKDMPKQIEQIVSKSFKKFPPKA